MKREIDDAGRAARSAGDKSAGDKNAGDHAKHDDEPRA